MSARYLLIGFLLFMFSGTAACQEILIGGHVSMLALGDSYTIGESVEAEERWPYQLMDSLRKRGFEADDPEYIARTGWTTQQLIEGISSLPNKGSDFNLISILIGVNNQFQRLPMNRYQPDLRNIIERALDIVAHDTSRIFILSIPDYAYTGFGDGNEVISAEIDAYNEIKKSVAEDYGIAFVDITPISRRGLDDRSLIAGDGLHPSAKQYSEWVQAILPRISIDTSLVNRSYMHQNKNISVYPNPASQRVFVDSERIIDRVRLFTMQGSELANTTIEKQKAMIDISNLPGGFYLLTVHQDKSLEPVYRTILVIH